MSEGFIGSCKRALNNLISSDRIQASSEPYKDFAEGIRNFYSHYFLDDHTSSWCFHEKVNGIWRGMVFLGVRERRKQFMHTSKEANSN